MDGTVDDGCKRRSHKIPQLSGAIHQSDVRADHGDVDFLGFEVAPCRVEKMYCTLSSSGAEAVRTDDIGEADRRQGAGGVGSRIASGPGAVLGFKNRGDGRLVAGGWIGHEPGGGRLRRGGL